LGLKVYINTFRIFKNKKDVIYKPILMNRCIKEDLNFVVVAAKKIWARRNAVVHGGVFTPLNQIVCGVEEQLWKLKELAAVQEGRQRGNGERT
jgi:hypothetical protein